MITSPDSEPDDVQEAVEVSAAGVRFGHLGVVAGCFFISFFITGASCPFAGPSTPDALFFMLGIVLVVHLIVAVVSLVISRFTLISALLVSLICLAPSLFFAVIAIREDIYDRHYLVYDRVRDQLVDPVPESVKNASFVTLDEMIFTHLCFRFDIAPEDLRRIIKAKGLKLTKPEDLKCPADFFLYPYYIPVEGPYVLYQATIEYDQVITLKVNQAHTHAIFRRQGSRFYEERPWEEDMAHGEIYYGNYLEDLKKEWEAKQNAPAAP
jgi:hypothetical protein